MSERDPKAKIQQGGETRRAQSILVRVDGELRAVTAAKQRTGEELETIFDLPELPSWKHLVGWYDAQRIEASDGDFLSEWADSSCRANTADDVSGEEPTYELDDDIYSFSTVATEGDGALVLTDEVLTDGSYTLAGLVKANSTNGTQRIVQDGSLDNGGWGTRIEGGTWEHTHYGAEDVDTGVSVEVGEPIRWIVRYDASNESLDVYIDGELEVDGQSVGLDNPDGEFAIGKMIDGDDQFADCNHGEYLVWNDYKDDATVDKIDEYLEERWTPLANYDATQIDYSDGEAVDEWKDEVRDNDLTAPSGRRPTYRADEIDGNPAVEVFNDEYMVSDETFALDREFAVLFVMVDPSPAGNNHILSFRDSNGFIFRYRDDDADIWATTDDGTVNPSWTPPESTPSLNAGVVTNSADMTVASRVDGTEEESVTQTGTFPTVNMALGADPDGDLTGTATFGEIVVYDSLDSDRLESEEQRLADKWGISLD